MANIAELKASVSDYSRGAVDAFNFVFQALEDYVPVDNDASSDITKNTIRPFLKASKDKWDMMLVMGSLMTEKPTQQPTQPPLGLTASGVQSVSAALDENISIDKVIVELGEAQITKEEEEYDEEEGEAFRDEDEYAVAVSSTGTGASASASGKTKRCGNSLHYVWFPNIPRIRRLSCFHKNKARKDGLQLYCSECTREYKRRRTEEKKRKCNKPGQVHHCSICGDVGHSKDHCNSAVQIAEGMKRCNFEKHAEWFPKVPVVQSVASFNKGRNDCKSCNKKKQRDAYAAKRKGDKRAKKKPRRAAPINYYDDEDE